LTLVVDGREIDFVESGCGQTILFVSGSYGTPAAWRGMQKHLGDQYHCIATSICGYGKTEDTRTYDDLGMEHEVKVIQGIAEHVGKPLNLVGHSFGATVALASALSGSLDFRSITTYEANPLALIREHGSQELFDVTHRMSTDFEKAYDRGEQDAAGRIIDFWGGEGSFSAMPDVVKEYCRNTVFSNVLDWRTAFNFHATKADYGKLDMPVLLVRGSLANEAMVAITDGLADGLPNVRTEVVEGASHFLITSHPESCAALLMDFLSDVR